MKILLICIGGVSTSILERSIKSALAPGQEDWVVESHSINFLNELIGDFDVLLLGPHLRHKLNLVKQIAKKHGKPCDIIDSRTYAFGQGDKVLKRAIELVEANKTE